MSNQASIIEEFMSYDDYMRVIEEYPVQSQIMRLWSNIQEDADLTEFEREALHAELCARRRRG